MTLIFHMNKTKVKTKDLQRLILKYNKNIKKTWQVIKEAIIEDKDK